MKPFCEVKLSDLADWLEANGEKPYHAKQIFSWVYERFIPDWEAMTNLSQELRVKLKKAFRLPALTLVKVQDSDDKETYKFLWRLVDGNLVESVLICSGARRTVCVSSQVGCPASCAFCASGKNGFVRNLATGEIVEQIVGINAWLKAKGEKVTHIVYMGMGEPLKNYEHVVDSIKLITDPSALNLSQRRITVSTVGIIDGIKRLTKENLKISLVLSLHAPNQHIRKKIIPYARKYPLEELISAMDEYSRVTKRDITYEYILISGINDHPDHAQELGHLLKGKQCTVNLIPYNPVPGLKLKKPEKKAVKAFRSVLYGCKIVNTCRYTKGDDIAAACGQLALQQNDSKLKIVDDKV